MTGIKLQQSVCSFCRPPPFILFLLTKYGKTYICAFLDAMLTDQMHDCCALVKHIMDARRQGCVCAEGGRGTERCELSENLKKDICRWEGRKKKKMKPTAHMCACAQIFLPLPTQFSGGKGTT